MGILWFIFIFISLIGHGDALGPDSCNHAGGLCRVGNCVSGNTVTRRNCGHPYYILPLLASGCCNNIWYHLSRTGKARPEPYPHASVDQHKPHE
ncbi:gallinacin-12 prepropeptide precursor [Patagioenas fasciata monilis]|uniref:Gallinacin-12 prepropeptide n=1 Tax=Patagioenas fasciata monilis TaxID=372326 RepID=A0A1V4JVB7_PATFA|nr:gallinacin-12 prepropeptide precursor [Patagioenas fasciata monilis]